MTHMITLLNYIWKSCLNDRPQGMASSRIVCSLSGNFLELHSTVCCIRHKYLQIKIISPLIGWRIADTTLNLNIGLKFIIYQMIIHTEYYILWVSADFQSFIYKWIDDAVIHESVRVITLLCMLGAVLSFSSLPPILLSLRTAVNNLDCLLGYRTREAYWISIYDLQNI